MKDRTTFNYLRKIQNFLSADNYYKIENELFEIDENKLEAFWNLIIAGYSINFAILNYVNVYEYNLNNSTSYSSTLKNIYSVFPGLNAGISIIEPEWFELN